MNKIDQPDRAVVMIVAGLAGVDWRTVERYFLGLPMKSLAKGRIQRALEENPNVLGLTSQVRKLPEAGQL
jgi:hypothetical protein